MKKLFLWGINFIKNMDWAETLRYLIIGICTTLVNILCFWLFTEQLAVHELVANILAWIIATAFAFFTNCLYVFKMKPRSRGEYASFAAKFLAGRIFSLGVEELLIYLLITVAALPSMPVKVAVTCLTIAINYFISKLLVFTRKNPAAEKEQSHD